MRRGRFRPKLRWGVIGSAAPVFPGFEVDILDRVDDADRPDAVWHRERARAILAAHPEVRSLFGRTPVTAFFCLGVAALQWGLAILAGRWPWWGAVLLAWGVGGPLNVALFQLAHECDHGLVFRRAKWNRWLFTWTSAPMLLWGHHSWWVEHLVHHTDMGAKKDFITRRRSFFLISRPLSPLFFPYAALMVFTQCLRSVLGLILFMSDVLRGRMRPSDRTLAVLADEHLASGYKQDGLELWAVGYPLTCLLLTGAAVSVGGWQALLYLFAAELFFTGFLHPYCLGLVLGVSHFHGRQQYQPSSSNYSRLVNWTTFNIGLHTEHHDLAAIPWFRLPRLRRLAPEFYDSLQPVDSYVKLGWRFVFANPEHFRREFHADSFENLKRFRDGGRAAPRA